MSPNSLAFPSLSVSLLSSGGEVEEGMSGVAIFFTVLFCMLGFFMLIVVGLVVYSHWNENRRKRFY